MRAVALVVARPGSEEGVELRHTPAERRMDVVRVACIEAGVADRDHLACPGKIYTSALNLYGVHVYQRTRHVVAELRAGISFDVPPLVYTGELFEASR